MSVLEEPIKEAVGVVAIREGVKRGVIEGVPLRRGEAPLAKPLPLSFKGEGDIGGEVDTKYTLIDLRKGRDYICLDISSTAVKHQQRGYGV